MKKRIIFVDDEPREIENLRRAVAGLSEIWSIHFAESGPQALELMAKESFDAIVADMRMPGMNGVELLNEVGKLYPKTLRFILSSFGDRDLIMTCVWGTHQFISKPCDPATLLTTVQRALALGVWLSNDELKELVSKMGNFPSLPSTYFEVLKQLQSPGASVQSISDVIAKDLAVTAKLLQMVNSAFFGLPQKLTNPFEAVAILGVDTVKSLVLCIQVFTHFDKLKRSKFSMDKLWSHSMRVATSAKRIALAETQDQKMADEAFTAGLMHDIGKLVLASNLAEQYNAVLESARKNQIPLWQAEKDNFGASHADTGAYLLGLWGMPITLLEASALHHTPSQCFSKTFSSLTAVHIANAFEHENSENDGFVPAQIDVEYLKEIGLEDRIETWRKASSGETCPDDKNEDAPEPYTASPQFEGQRAALSSFARSDRLLWVVAPVAACFAFVLVAWLLWESWKTDLLPADAKSLKPSKASQQQLAQAATPELISKSAPAPASPPVLSGDNTNLSAKPRATTQSPAASDPSSSIASPNENALATESRDAKPIFPALKLQGIFYRADNPSAMINGKLLFKGEAIKGAQIVAIDRQSVTLRYAGESKVLTAR